MLGTPGVNLEEDQVLETQGFGAYQSLEAGNSVVLHTLLEMVAALEVIRPVEERINLVVATSVSAVVEVVLQNS